MNNTILKDGTRVELKIIRNSDDKLIGYVLGKTDNAGQKELVYQLGVNIKRIKITPRTEKLYRIIATQAVRS